MRTRFIFILAVLTPAFSHAATAIDQLRLQGAPAAFGAAAVPVPEINAMKGEDLGRGETQREAVRLAKEYLDASLLHKDKYPNEKFWQETRELRSAFDNKFQFKTESCGNGQTLMYTTKDEYYEAQSSSRKKNIIHVCKGYAPGAELMAQDLIHETSHLVLAAFENQATEFEMVTVSLGGGYPVMNGYVSYQEGLSQAELDWLGYGYLPMALGITSDLSYHYQFLRANIVYGDLAAFKRNLAKLPEERRQLLAFTDLKGFTLKSVAAKYGRTDFLNYLLALEQAR